MQNSFRVAALIAIELVFVCGPLMGEMREGEIPKKFQGILLYAPYPKYPVDLVRRGIRGHGLFRLSFDSKTGRVTEVKVLNSTGYVILNELAAKALLQWRTRPGVISSLRVPITFLPAGFTRVVH
jgi:TonB family protein